MLLPYRSDGELDYARAVMPLEVREHAVELSRPYAPHSGLWSVPQALALFHHVRNLAYIADPLGVDAYVQEPDVTLRMGAGNCEAKAALLSGLDAGRAYVDAQDGYEGFFVSIAGARGGSAGIGGYLR